MYFRSLMIAIFLVISTSCGPNVLQAKGKVMNPLVKDSKELAFIRQVTIVRKEPSLKGRHIIVGVRGKPRAEGALHEIAEIPHQHTNGNGLLVTFEIYSIHMAELVDFKKTYTFWIVLPDGRRIKGEYHRLWKLKNLTQKVTGGSQRTHLVVRDKRSGTTTAYRHWEEVENEYQLYWRKVRIVFLAEDLVTLDTPKVILEAHGEQRIRRYTFNFTKDPLDLMSEEERASYQEEKANE